MEAHFHVLENILISRFWQVLRFDWGMMSVRKKTMSQLFRKFVLILDPLDSFYQILIITLGVKVVFHYQSRITHRQHQFDNIRGLNFRLSDQYERETPVNIPTISYL